MPTLYAPFSVVHSRSYLMKLYSELPSKVSPFGDPCLPGCCQSHHQRNGPRSPPGGGLLPPSWKGRAITPLLPGVGRTVGTLFSVKLKGTFFSPLLPISCSNPHLLFPSSFSVFLTQCPLVHQTTVASFALRSHSVYKRPLLPKTQLLWCRTDPSSACVLTLPRVFP